MLTARTPSTRLKDSSRYRWLESFSNAFATRTGLFLCALCAAPAARAAQADRIERSFALGTTPAVAVDNIAGLIAIAGGAAREVKLSASKEGGSAEERARVEIEVKAGASSLAVRTRCGERWGDCRGVRVIYRLSVPRGARVHARSVNAPVEIKGVQGAIEAETVNGRLEVSGSGAAALALKTVNGALGARATSGSVRASTVNGSVEIGRAPRAGGEVSVKSVSGAVRILVDPRAAAEVRLSTLSGALSTNLPLAELRKDRHGLRGRLGAGGATIGASSVSGSLAVLAL
jgi:hypothetical protein